MILPLRVRGRSALKAISFGATAGPPRDDCRIDAGELPPHRSRLDGHRREIGDHDATGLGLPPIVVKRPAVDSLAPYHRFGVERFADTGEKPKA